jgi:hypothetical protein
MVKWPWYFYDISIDNYSFREGRVADLSYGTTLGGLCGF